MRRTLVLWLLLLVGLYGVAQSSRISDLEKKRKAALAEIEKTTSQLSKNKKSTQSTLSQLNALNKQIKAREGYVKELNTQLGILSQEVEENQAEYNDLSRKLSIKKSNYVKSLRLMARQNPAEDKLMFLLSARNLNELARRMRYLEEYGRYQKLQARQISRKQDELKEIRINLELSYKEKETVKGQHEREAAQLARERLMKNTLVNRLKGQQKQLNTELSKQKRQADQLARQIQNIIAEEAKKAMAKAAADKSKPREAAVKGGYAMTSEEKKLSGSFASNRGALGYPVSMPGTIVVHYGEEKYQDLKHVSNASKGIDIQTKAGASALCVFNGVVSKVFALPGFNNSVIVRHGNYLTVYSNLSSVFVKSGDKVGTGQALGKIYVDGEQGGQTILHFQLWQDTQRLNPEGWLRKR
jgi:murein hydrolase activator